MKDKPNSPVHSKTDLTTFNIEIDRLSLANDIVIRSIVTQSQILQQDTAEINLVMDSGELPKPGNKISISAGYHSDDKNIFLGEVTEISLSINDKGCSYNLLCKSRQIRGHNFNTNPKSILTLTAGFDILSLQKSWDGKTKDLLSVGEVTFQGNSSALPGKALTIKGTHPYFEGDALISKVVHDIRDGNWITTVGLGYCI